MSKKINYWKHIRDRLHEESGLHYPRNTMSQLFETFFNEILNQFSTDNRLFVDQGFLVTSSGLYLDIRGNELGLPRKEGKYASGKVIFTLTREIDKTKTPKPIPIDENEDIVYDYTPEDVQTLIDQINLKRKQKGNSTILETREATSIFTVPSGTVVYSDTGFEYILQNNVNFVKGQTYAEGVVRAKDSGERYNTEIDTLSIFGESNFPIDLSNKIVELTDQTSCPTGFTFKTSAPLDSELAFEIIVKNGEPVYITENNKLYLKPVYNTQGALNKLSTGESVQTAVFKKVLSGSGTYDEQILLPTRQINIYNDTKTLKISKTVLNYEDSSTYKFLTYVKGVGGTDINKDLLVFNAEPIDGGEDGESDDSYRQRLLNNINTNISINYLKKQGIIIYSKKNLKDDVRTKMTSFNPYLNNKYDVIPPDNEVFDFVKYELIADPYIMVYIRGW